MPELQDTVAIERYLQLLKGCLTASIYDESAWSRLASDQVSVPGWDDPVGRIRGWLKRWLLLSLERRNLMLIRLVPFSRERREQGRDWPLFGYSMVGHRRLENLQNLTQTILTENVPGDLIETGAWRGGSTIWMRALLQAYGDRQRTVWVADSFEGLPAPELAPDKENRAHDLSQVSFLKVSLEQVQANFARFGLLDQQVRFLKGWFKDTLPSAPIQSLALLRLDGDLYESTRDALEALYARVSPGGFVVVNDYGDWEPCRRAVVEFRERNGILAELMKIDGNGVYWRVP